VRILDPSQDALVEAGQLAPINLVIIRTYADRAAGTPGPEFWFTDRGLIYSYDAAPADWWPLLQGVDPIRQAIDHVPTRSLRGAVRSTVVRLSNEMWQGQRLAQVLRTAATLENADIELSQIVTPRVEMPVTDLSAMAGTEHTVFLRARIERVGPISGAVMELQVTTALPEVEWKYALDSSITDPKDVGARLPIVYGAADRVPAVSLQVGWVTTLAETIQDPAQTTWQLTDTTGLADVGVGLVGGNSISWSGKLGNTIQGVAFTGPEPFAIHRAGEQLVEVINEAIFALAGHPLEAIRDLYAVSPFSGELWRITTGYTPELADVEAPGFEGEAIATARFSNTEMTAAVLEMSVAYEVTTVVTQQPDPPPLPSNPPTPQAARAAAGGLNFQADHVRDGIDGTTSAGDWPYQDANQSNTVYVVFADPGAGTWTSQTLHVWMRKSYAFSGGTVQLREGASTSGTLLHEWSVASLPATASS
jgi:hypothetical protein